MIGFDSVAITVPQQGRNLLIQCLIRYPGVGNDLGGLNPLPAAPGIQGVLQHLHILGAIDLGISATRQRKKKTQPGYSNHFHRKFLLYSLETP
jgi:hypothetical protein